MQGKDKKISHEGEYRASGLVHRKRFLQLAANESQGKRECPVPQADETVR